MIIIKNGNLLNAEEDILVHQVNVDGIMGGGVAKQIATLYPKTNIDYKKFCKERRNKFDNLKGSVHLTKENGKYIANMFSQDEKFNTDYEAMEFALNKIKKFAEEEKKTVAMPFKIGCGIANGEWELVMNLINKAFKGYEVVLYKLNCKGG